MGAGHGEPGRRSPPTAAGSGAGSGGDDRPQLAGGHGGDQAGPLGGDGARPDRGVPVRGPRADVHVGPPRPGGGPPRLRRQTRPGVATDREVMMGQYTSLIVERHGPVGWLLNNRPEQLNAMTAQMREEFGDAWNELDADPEVRVIVHTGEGRAFPPGV